jgi:hypothetical protein
MNSLSPHAPIADTYISRINEEKLIEGRLQLEDEAESHGRRIRMRRQRQMKLAAVRRIQRRKRAVKLAMFWASAVAVGAFAAVWNSNEIVQFMTRVMGAV